MKHSAYLAQINNLIDGGRAELLFREHGPHLTGLDMGADVYVMRKR